MKSFSYAAYEIARACDNVLYMKLKMAPNKIIAAGEEESSVTQNDECFTTRQSFSTCSNDSFLRVHDWHKFVYTAYYTR